MLKTIVMTGDRQELPIDLGIEKAKISNRIDHRDNWSTDSMGCMFEGLCITAGEDNIGSILVSDYTAENQVNDGNVADFIELLPKGELLLPWNREVSALNRPIVMGQEGDILKIIAR